MKIAKTVEKVLNAFPDARDSDKELLLITWSNLGLCLTNEQVSKFLDIPSPETITRIRRKLQEEGKYLGHKKVRQARRIKEAVVQQNAPTASPERLDDVLQTNHAVHVDMRD